MTNEQYLKNLDVPSGRVDAVLDTDAFNELDDQFAIAYLLRSKEKINTVAMYAAPFSRTGTSAGVGMEQSYNELSKIMTMCGESVPTYRGSTDYLPDEKTPVISPAAEDLARRANEYTPENPLYVIAIGAITNIASAILINPAVCENCVVVWLGGHSHEHGGTDEYNMRQDIAAARVVIGSGVPFVQVPCACVASAFSISGAELRGWLSDTNEVADYLARNVIAPMEKYHTGKCWSRIIWDVTAVGWVLNDKNRFMYSRVIPAMMPGYEGRYEPCADKHPMRYVFYIIRDSLMQDMTDKICNN